MAEQTICELVRKRENEYVYGTTTISKYVQFSQYENIEKIDAYLNSKHISGETDAMGRDKPFFNIVTAATNVWYKATDIDRKNIRIKANKQSDTTEAFLATVKLQEWMQKDNFGVFLNDWGRSLSRYGSSVLKFVEKDGMLYASVVPWNRLISDTVDFENNVKIEKLFMTPAQLRKHKGYDKEVVKSLLDSYSTRQLLDKQRKDNLSGYIEIYEVHGELPLSMLTDNDDDEDTYVQQMHVVSFVGTGTKDEYDDFTLVKGKESKDPYMITHLIKEDGRSQSIGAVEHLFEAQWMQNHSVKMIKDQLDLASKLIFQTSDGNYVGRNALNSIENGDILIHEMNQPLTQINNGSHDITQAQNFAASWKQLGQEITGTPDVLMGKTPPSGQAWRLNNEVRQEAHSLFELMTENKGLAIEDMMRKYVLPYIKKQLNNKDEIVASLDAEQIKQIDAMFLPNEAIRKANKKIIEKVLDEGIMVSPEEQSQMIQEDMASMQQGLGSLGGKRYIQPDDVTWKEVLKNLEWDVEVEVTGENTEKAVILETINTMLQTLANPNTAQAIQTPQGKMLWNKALETTGILSPIQIMEQSIQTPMPSPIQQPIGGV